MAIYFSKYQEKSGLGYLDWNNQIAKNFFKPEKAGTRVWFSVERILIEKIAQENNTDFKDFIKAVKKGPDWINRSKQTVCSKASAVLKGWRDKGYEYPPYIAYLALFVLTVNHGDNDNFSEGDYYGRLKVLVDEILSTNHFKSTIDLWDDLEKWSQSDKAGCWGEFYNDTVGKNFYVGIPYYQVVLKEKDKSGLSQIFWEMGWDSESNPTEEEILRALKESKSLLSKRTSRRIEKGEPNFLSILTDRVLEELKEYNEDEEQTDNTNQISKRGFIDLCLDIDKIAGKAEFYFRCRKTNGLPAKKFILQHGSSKLEVVHASFSLSKKIENLYFDDWEKDFSAKAGKYNFCYKGSKYKVFMPAYELEVGDWISISGQRYSPGKPFYLAVHNSLSSKVQKWGESECDQCQKLAFDDLPENWHLFEINKVKSDKGIKQDIPALSIDQNLRINFEHGIRPARGNKFFNFAPPKIRITGGVKQISALEASTGKDKKIRLISSQEEVNTFHLPKSIRIGEKIIIEIPKDEAESVKKSLTLVENTLDGGDTPLVKKSFMLVENRLKRFSDYLEDSSTSSVIPARSVIPAKAGSQQNKVKRQHFGMDHFGNFVQIQQESAYFKGAYCQGLTSGGYPRLPDIPLDSTRRTYLVGNTPGQIVDWPRESLPEKWEPVWMIQFKSWKKSIAHLIGMPKNQKDLSANENINPSKEKIQLWKKILWINRKRIKSKAKQWKTWGREVKKCLTIR